MITVISFKNMCITAFSFESISNHQQEIHSCSSGRTPPLSTKSIQNLLNYLANSQTNTLLETITDILIWVFQVLICEFFLSWQIDLVVPDAAQWASVSLWTVAQREENLLLISTSNLSIYLSSHHFSYTGLRGGCSLLLGRQLENQERTRQHREECANTTQKSLAGKTEARTFCLWRTEPTSVVLVFIFQVKSLTLAQEVGLDLF